MSSKRYPEEFKIEAVKQVTEKYLSACLVVFVTYQLFHPNKPIIQVMKWLAYLG